MSNTGNFGYAGALPTYECGRTAVKNFGVKFGSVLSFKVGIGAGGGIVSAPGNPSRCLILRCPH